MQEPSTKYQYVAAFVGNFFKWFSEFCLILFTSFGNSHLLFVSEPTFDFVWNHAWLAKSSFTVNYIGRITIAIW